MADFVDNLTDAELRTKLAEYGFPVVPITATTRKVMAKKLKLLIENKKKINSEGRRSLAKYSSEEESDTDTKNSVNKSKDKSRRATMAVGSMLPPTSSKLKKTETKRNVTQNNDTNNVDAKSNSKRESPEILETTTTTTTRRLIKNQYVDDEANEYSDSDIEVVETKSSSPINTKTSSPIIKKGSSSSASPSPPTRSSKSKYTSLATEEDEPLVEEEPEPQPTTRSTYFSSLSGLKTGGSDHPGLFGRASGLRASGLHQSPISSNSRSEYLSNISSRSSLSSPTLDNLNQIRSRLGLSTPLSERSTAYDRKTVFGTSSTSAAASGVTSSSETPYISDFTKWLSSNKTDSKRGTNDYDLKKDIIKENDVNGGQYSKSFASRYADRNLDLSREFKKSQEKNLFRNNVVSFTLVGIVCVFFLALSFLYMGMRTDHVPQIDLETDNLPYCETLSTIPSLLLKPGVNCIKKDSVEPAIALLKTIQPELQRRAINFKCDGSKSAPHMFDHCVIDYVQKIMPDVSKDNIRTDLYNLHVIILSNPKLGLSLIEVKNVYDSKFDEPIIKDAEVLRRRSETNLAIIKRNPDLPLRCLIHLRLYTIAWYLLLVSAASLLVYGLQYIVKYFLRLNREKNKKIYEMVEQIIDILSRNASGNENYLAVSHVRDMIIPVQDRKKLNSIWNAAVNFLENNESRIRSEVQIVAGEEYRVWRWLGNAALNLSGTRGKVWQGQAFDTSQEGSVNSLPVSPTQCLKIRQMFEKNDITGGNWSQVIKDAILEKCGENCKIIHIGIDKETCCVYVKCASEKDAGIAYRNLHGWWYDGKLITVKYLRLERYLGRFPDSRSSGPYLKPSNNKKLSLQNDWSSNNEDN